MRRCQRRLPQTRQAREGSAAPCGSAETAAPRGAAACAAPLRTRGGSFGARRLAARRGARARRARRARAGSVAARRGRLRSRSPGNRERLLEPCGDARHGDAVRFQMRKREARPLAHAVACQQDERASCDAFPQLDLVDRAFREAPLQTALLVDHRRFAVGEHELIALELPRFVDVRAKPQPAIGQPLPQRRSRSIASRSLTIRRLDRLTSAAASACLAVRHALRLLAVLSR